MSKQTALEELDSQIKSNSPTVAMELNTKEVLEYLEDNWDKIKIITSRRSIYVQQYFAVIRHLKRHFGDNFNKSRVQTFLISKGLITPRVAFVLLFAIYWFAVILIELVFNLPVRYTEGGSLLSSAQKYLCFYPMFMFVIPLIWFVATLEKEY